MGVEGSACYINTSTTFLRIGHGLIQATGVSCGFQTWSRELMAELMASADDLEDILRRLGNKTREVGC
jgi:hypothetical protein